MKCIVVILVFIDEGNEVKIIFGLFKVGNLVIE